MSIETEIAQLEAMTRRVSEKLGSSLVSLKGTHLVLNMNRTFELLSIQLIDRDYPTTELCMEIAGLMRDYVLMLQKIEPHIKKVLSTQMESMLQSKLWMENLVESNSEKIDTLGSLMQKEVITAADEDKLVCIETNLMMSSFTVKVTTEHELSPEIFIYAYKDAYEKIYGLFIKNYSRLCSMLGDNAFTSNDFSIQHFFNENLSSQPLEIQTIDSFDRLLAQGLNNNSGRLVKSENKQTKLIKKYTWG
ncbi:MAG: hypothetical protein PHV30_04790 [Candidatus Margulisbacteria bacterium]|nr:hypothetical protein [Candidatus Margulisiibacteriota bacterium]